jgi:hypothetical protein
MFRHRSLQNGSQSALRAISAVMVLLQMGH